MNDDSEARRLALALLRLRETGDHAGMRLLVAGLDADTLRAALISQTENASTLLEGLFSTIAESRLPLLAALHRRPRGEVVDDHLGQLIYRLAGAQRYRGEE